MLPRNLFPLGLVVLIAAGCRRTPQTAAELAKALPAQYAGELHLQGEQESRRLRIGVRELSAINEHLLEFNSVAYEVEDAQGAPIAKGTAAVRGTISAPALEIRLEQLGPDVPGGTDLLQPNTFAGQLTGNLNTLTADWTTGYGQKAHLQLKAARDSDIP